MVNNLESLIISEISQNNHITNIQNIIFPKTDICTVEELFFRGNSKVLFNYEHQSIEIRQGGIISFDTYFNGFFVDNWKSYTNIRHINICLQLQGKFTIKILNIDPLGETKNVLSQKIINSRNLEKITIIENLDIFPYTGMIYIEMEALSNNCQINGGYFYSYTDKKPIKLAVVICTYKREAYVYKNINLLEKYLLKNQEWEEKLEIFIIDNGNTLESFDNYTIHIIPNKNAGGSGGFARGMIKVLERKTEFSHIILMDDDVLFEPESLNRLWNFVSVSSEPDICIGGSMLRLDKKFIQHERGAYWKNGCVALKNNLDLRSLKDTLFNEIEEFVEYHAWWLFCFPTSAVQDFGLPYPFFVKLDDLEFGKRINRKIVTMNGICVWHEPFENKYSPTIEYYCIRNTLILNCLHFSQKFSSITAIKWFLKPIFKEIFCYKYETAEYILKAISDFLKGPYNLVNSDPEKKHKELSKVVEKTSKNFDIPFIYDKYVHSINQTETTLNRFLRYITLNGHLLPSWLFLKEDFLTDNGYKIAPCWGSRPLNVFRAKKVLYYNLQTKEGFVVQFSRIRFFQILFQAIWLALIMFFKFPQLKKLYVSTLPDFTSQAFWEKYLEIEKTNNNHL
ncbi:glycosyltransferase [Sphaerospermopsis aphanizomenoides BCCUSP55]|uniref:glycosyltransferase n=1 Tax=Sphaerospermopsis aphanizomenoides TaxID=459663 RepID=UPI001903B394|nr:glycosyltransferase [Sphaerospermopsis aphanizomenoides]MBK1990752.1 glycosyltransferase [Sphaerospermopsis aphanizomenoides BCCUSP55]